MKIFATVFPEPIPNPMRLFLILFSLFPAALHAQIYADFTVRQGTTPLGTFRVLLEHTKAPRTCANFIGLASGKRPWIDVTSGAVRTDKPYYNGLTFHRLIHNFVIQGGSPNGQGTDGPGYTILDEYEPTLRHSSDYVLSMAKSGRPNTGGSQFFITLAATPNLNDKHSVFGKVISGTAIIDGFKNPTLFPTGSGDVPVAPIVMESVVISGPSYAGFDINHPSLAPCLRHGSDHHTKRRRILDDRDFQPKDKNRIFHIWFSGSVRMVATRYQPEHGCRECFPTPRRITHRTPLLPENDPRGLRPDTRRSCESEQPGENPTNHLRKRRPP